MVKVETKEGQEAADLVKNKALKCFVTDEMLHWVWQEEKKQKKTKHFTNRCKRHTYYEHHGPVVSALCEMTRWLNPVKSQGLVDIHNKAHVVLI